MTDTTLLGPWVRRFLLEHLIGERNLSRQTQLSYRDTLRLLLLFAADQYHQPLDHLTVGQLSSTWGSVKIRVHFYTNLDRSPYPGDCPDTCYYLCS